MSRCRGNSAAAPKETSSAYICEPRWRLAERSESSELETVFQAGREGRCFRAVFAAVAVGLAKVPASQVPEELAHAGKSSKRAPLALLAGGHQWRLEATSASRTPSRNRSSEP